MHAAKRPAIPASTSHQSSAYVASRSQAEHLPGSQPVARQRAYTPKRKPHAGARQAIAFESSVKLTVNLLLAVVATTTIAKLVPYYQTQQTRLATLQESVTSAEAKNAELRSRFKLLLFNVFFVENNLLNHLKTVAPKRLYALKHQVNIGWPELGDLVDLRV